MVTDMDDLHQDVVLVELNLGPWECHQHAHSEAAETSRMAPIWGSA